ncbi:MAG: CHASE domain-containing protein [Myxococcales bacterium]
MLVRGRRPREEVLTVVQAPARSSLLPRQRAPAYVLAVALLATAAVTLALYSNARARDRTRFRNVVQATSDRIEGRLDAYVTLLRATGAVFRTQHEVTAQEFHDYVRLLDLPRLYPGTRGIGFTLRFAASQREEVERRVRAHGGVPDFRVWPVTGEAEQHAIVMLEPLDARNRAAVGYDMHTEPVRRQAMDAARDTGEPAMTAKVTLQQEIDEQKQPGFLVYVPVYAQGEVPQTLEERRRRLVGFVYSPFRTGDLLTGIFGTEPLPDAAFELYDGSVASPQALLYRTHPAQELAHQPVHTATVALEVADHPWTLVVRSLPAFERSGTGQLTAWAPFALVGLLLSLALFGVTKTQAQGRERAERHAAELRQAVEERARVEEQLREADRRKDEFLAMLAHELRNPLAPVLTAVQLMDLKLGDDRMLAHEREVIARQTHHLRRLVDDLLDVSRVTRGKIRLQKTPVDLVGAARQALDAARPIAHESGQLLVARLPPEPLWAEVDPVRLQQVLGNLLHNAAKYSEPGGRITLSLSREGESAVASVEDTGIGIPASSLPHLFEPFVQLRSSLDRAQGGLGLGLTLVKRLVEMHGGTVEAASEGAGRGSRFTVRLPLLPADQVPAPALAASGKEERTEGRRRVMVVDDNLDAAKLWPRCSRSTGTRSRSPTMAGRRSSGSRPSRPTWCSWTSASPGSTATRSRGASASAPRAPGSTWWRSPATGGGATGWPRKRLASTPTWSSPWSSTRFGRTHSGDVSRPRLLRRSRPAPNPAEPEPMGLRAAGFGSGLRAVPEVRSPKPGAVPSLLGHPVQGSRSRQAGHIFGAFPPLTTGSRLEVQMQQITPFLWFDGQAEQAARFYVSVFKKGSKILEVSRYPEGSPGKPGSVMTVQFRAAGLEFIALNGGPEYHFTPAVSFSVSCKTQQEVDRLWKALTKGGKEVQCGWLEDRYGVSWQIIPEQLPELMGDPDPEKAQRVTAALMKMKKIDVRALKAARDSKKPARK